MQKKTPKCCVLCLLSVMEQTLHSAPFYESITQTGQNSDPPDTMAVEKLGLLLISWAIKGRKHKKKKNSINEDDYDVTVGSRSVVSVYKVLLSTESAGEVRHSGESILSAHEKQIVLIVGGSQKKRRRGLLRDSRVSTRHSIPHVQHNASHVPVAR